MHILILTCAYLKPIKRLTCPRSRRSADHPLPSARPLPHLRQIALIQQIKSLYMAAMKYTAQLDNMNIPLSRLQHMVWQKYVCSESDSTICACTNNKNHSGLPHQLPGTPSCKSDYSASDCPLHPASTEPCAPYNALQCHRGKHLKKLLYTAPPLASHQGDILSRLSKSDN